MKDRIARSVFWLVWSRGVVHGASLLSTVLVARLLSPSDYGLMALATIWTGTLALVVELGLGPTIIQFPDLEEGELNICFWLTMALACGGYAALYAASPAVAEWFATPRLSDVLRVAGLTLPLAALRLVPEGLLRKRLALDKVSQAEVAGILVTIPLVLTLAWRGAGVWALVAGSLAMPLVQTVTVFTFVRWSPGLRVRSARAGALLRYGAGALGARASWAAYEQVDLFVLGRVAGDVVLGFYAMAKALANLPVVKISAVVNQLALPVMAGFQADQGALRASFLRALRLVASVTVPACVGMALVADDIVLVALGAKWQPIVPIFRVLALFGLIHSLDALLPPILFARYRPSILFWWTGALLLVMPLAFWAGAVSIGALGVALAWVVVYPVMAAWMAREGLREIETDWRTLWNELQPVVTASLLMAASVVGVRFAVAGVEPFTVFLRVGLSVGTGAAVYVVALRWRGPRLVGELMEVAGWLFPRTGTVAPVQAPRSAVRAADTS